MNVIAITICTYLVMAGIGCSSVPVPRAVIRQTDYTYESDLKNLRKYIDTLPVDVVVAGLPIDGALQPWMTVDSASKQTIYREMVITTLTRDSFAFTPHARFLWGDTVVVPTISLAKVSANGFLLRPAYTSFWWLALLGVGLLGGAFVYARLATASESGGLSTRGFWLLIGAAALFYLLAAAGAWGLEDSVGDVESGRLHYDQINSTWTFE